jgi:TPR repeat protein
MTLRRLLLPLLLGYLGSTLAFAAQEPSQRERDVFNQTRIKANKGDPEAALKLASLYTTGTGVAKDPAKAFKWRLKAAEQGLVDAQYQVAQDYTAGVGVKPDPEAAFTWFQKAALQGNVDAEVALGLCYKTGEGVDENGVAAVKWFREAMAKGSSRAKFELGLCYFEGTGVTKDNLQALKLAHAAADEGYPRAQERIGVCYERGQGVEKDVVEAYKWFALAASQDDERALDIRMSIARLEAVMTPDQIAQAQARASKFTATTNQTTAASAPKTGFVTVKTAEENSEIFVDGAFVGNPPARLKVPEGTHVIEVKKPGFKDYRRQIMVGAEADLTLQAALEKQ